MKQQKVWNFPGVCTASDHPSKALFQGCILVLSPAGPSTEWFSSGWSSAGLGTFYCFSPTCFKDIGNKNKTTNTNVLHSLRSLKMCLPPEFRCVLDSWHTRALFLQSITFRAQKVLRKTRSVEVMAGGQKRKGCALGSRLARLSGMHGACPNVPNAQNQGYQSLPAGLLVGTPLR